MNDWISWQEAREQLHISRGKMTTLLAPEENMSQSGRLTWRKDPLDGRRRWIKASDVDALKNQHRAMKGEATA